MYFLCYLYTYLLFSFSFEVYSGEDNDEMCFRV